MSTEQTFKRIRAPSSFMLWDSTSTNQPKEEGTVKASQTYILRSPVVGDRHKIFILKLGLPMLNPDDGLILHASR